MCCLDEERDPCQHVTLAEFRESVDVTVTERCQNHTDGENCSIGEPSALQKRVNHSSPHASIPIREWVDGLELCMNECCLNERGVVCPVEVFNEIVDEESAKTGEKLQARRAVTVEGDNVAVYLHQRSADLPPAVGVLVSYEGDAEGAHAVALQIAAMNAEYLTREDVPAEVVEKEREIAEATTREEGKPEAALPKIVEGRLNGFFKSVVLLEQAALSDSKKTVEQVAKEAGTTIKGFVRYEVGA